MLEGFVVQEFLFFSTVFEGLLRSFQHRGRSFDGLLRSFKPNKAKTACVPKKTGARTSVIMCPGFLGSKKGKGGGYYLIKEPQDIKMTAVIRVLEGPIAMVPCVSLNYYEKCEDCPEEQTCSVHKLMIQVRDST